MEDPDGKARFARRARGEGLSVRSPRQRVLRLAIMAVAIYGGFSLLRWAMRERDPFLDQPFDADVVVEIQRICMNGSWSFSLELRTSGECRIDSIGDDRDTRLLSAAERDAIVDLFFRHGFPEMDASYVDRRGFDANGLRVGLNARGVRKRVVADGSDPGAGEIFRLVNEISARLGIDRFLESIENQRAAAANALHSAESR